MQQRLPPQRTSARADLEVRCAAFSQLYLVEDGELFAASVLQHASELDRELMRRRCGKRAW